MPVEGLGKLWNSALKDGSSSNMAVNGSATNKVYSVNPSANYDIGLKTVCLIAEFSGAVGIGNKFLSDAMATLANGLLIEAKFSDSAYTWATLKRTRDLIEVSIPEGGLNIIASTTSMIQIFLYLPPFTRMCRQGAFTADDYLKATVRDDLRALSYVEMFVQGVKL